MKKAFITGVSIFFTSVFLLSCQSNEKLIVGTWIPLDQSGQKSTVMKIKFLEDKHAVAQSSFGESRSQDTVSYLIKNEGKVLVTTERSGRVEELDIVLLNEKELKLCPKKDSKDTLTLVRE